MVDTSIIVAMSGRDSSDWVGPGLIGLAVILGLLVAVFFLWRSMNKQLKRVDFDQPDGGDQPNGGDEPRGTDRPDGPPASTASTG